MSKSDPLVNSRVNRPLLKLRWFGTVERTAETLAGVEMRLTRTRTGGSTPEDCLSGATAFVGFLALVDVAEAMLTVSTAIRLSLSC
jgi:hypothetical protein